MTGTITFKAEDWAKSVATLSRVASDRGVPALKHILFKDGMASATDLEVWLSEELPTRFEGSVMLPASNLGAALTGLSGDCTITLDGATARLNNCTGSAILPLGDASEFPSLPTPDEWVAEFEIDAAAFRDALKAGSLVASPAMGNLPVRAVCLRASENRIEVFAYAGGRSSWAVLNLDECEDFTAALDVSDLPVLLDVLEGAQTALISVADNSTHIACGTAKLRLRHVDSPKSIFEIIPKSPLLKNLVSDIEIPKADFRAALAPTIGRNRDSAVFLEWTSGRLTIIGGSGPNDIITRTAAINNIAPDCSISLNGKWLSEAVQAFPGDVVRLYAGDHGGVRNAHVLTEDQSVWFGIAQMAPRPWMGASALEKAA